MSLLLDLVSFLIGLVIATIVFYGLGRSLTGVNAKFSDSFWIALIGLVVQFILRASITYFLIDPLVLYVDPLSLVTVQFAWMMVSLLATFIMWVLLVQHFFDCLFARGFLVIAIGFVLIIILNAITFFALKLIFPGLF